MKKSTKVILAAVAIAAILLLSSEIWRNYSRRVLDLDMDMCDENGNVVHVIVDATQHRKPGESWRFIGQIYFDGKIFTNGRYEEERLVTTEFIASGQWAWPDEWSSSFSVAEKKDGTYYFMTYQLRGDCKDSWYANKDNTFQYFGPASTKEEAERIRDLWVQRE